MDKLADELLKMMLSPPLLVPDEQFADGGPVSPFSKATFSASDVLLVCKRFMRVATPALYETVIVRTKAQASALQAALTRSPEFGRYVRKLRLEGAYGKQLAKIIPLMPHVSDFCFTLSVYSDDSLAALSAAFTTLQPTRVVLTLADQRRARNKSHATLVSMLCSAIPTWTKLRQFRYALSLPYYSQCASEPTLADALVQNETVETVDISNRYWDMGGLPVPADVLLRSVSIRLIRLRISGSDARFNRALDKYPPSVKCRLRFVGSDFKGDDEQYSTTTIPSANPFYQPMQNASKDQRVAVWRRILSFAVSREQPTRRLSSYPPYTMFYQDYHTFVDSWFDSCFLDVSAAQKLLLVSHDIHNALLLALSCHLDIRCDKHMKHWTSLARTHEALASQVEMLQLNTRALAEDPEIDALFQKLSNLRSLDLGFLVPASVETLGRVGPAIGSSLRALTLSSRGMRGMDLEGWTSTPFSADVFSGFAALERLKIDIDCLRFQQTASCDFLPNLKELNVHLAHSSFFAMLSKFSLPHIQRFRVTTSVRKADSFIKKHGSKLVRVETTIGFNQKNLDSCPNLDVLEMSEYMQPSFTKSSHRRLRQVRLNWMPTREISKYKTFCQTVSRRNFPGLREIIVVPECEIWPAKERDVNKSSWPPLAEKLSKQGIILQDYSGCTWRPRLQL